MIDVLIVGTGEYVTGLSGAATAQSDKKTGVVALSVFELRRQGLVGRVALCGRDGGKHATIRRQFHERIHEVYVGMDTSFDAYPQAPDVDAGAYRQAIDSLKSGSAVIVFTPDDTHHEIARYAIDRGHHTLVAKPFVKTVAEHRELAGMARAAGVLAMVEVHKRFDPIYSDAVRRMRELGEFSFMSSYMSQPKHQLRTFGSWAGRSSDISYYLNSHHVDLLAWALEDLADPVSVFAGQSTGVASAMLERPIEDTITLMVEWRNRAGGNRGTSVHTASWIAPISDVHSQQRFFYMGSTGEIHVDQAHRGYSVSTDESGFSSPNPLFMNYLADRGRFAGQDSYGFVSIRKFIESACAIKAGQYVAPDFEGALPTAANTLRTTQILEAGRRSLDEGTPIAVEPV